MGIRLSGAGVGIIPAIIAAFVLVGFCLWGVIHWLSSDLQTDTGPVQRIDTSASPRKSR